MSLLRANGFPDAGLYPIAVVRDEAGIIEKRTNALLTTNAILTQSAISSMFSKEGGEAFTKLTTSLIED